MILTWNALYSSTVLWWTLRWELIVDMILQKNQQEFLPKYNPQKNILVRVTKIWQNNSSKKDFGKIRIENIIIKSKEFQHGRYMHPKNIPKKILTVAK
jgi:hypothetical protein